MIDEAYLPSYNVEVSPTTFRADIDKLIAEREFSTAINLLLESPADEIISSYGFSYCAMGSQLVIAGRPERLLGTSSSYKESRDWIFPQTGDNSDGSTVWENYCEVFARKYNKRVDKEFKNGNQ